MKRLFLLPIITCAACGLVWLSACKEEKEEPLHFETTAPTAYTFSETETSATFSVSGNTAWAVEVTEGRERCTVTPASGKSDATVTVRVTANPDYLQKYTTTLLITAGNYTKEIAITQAAPPCPGFSPGAIATAGQTVTIGGTPITINSAQAATGGDGNISYRWYKNGNVIEGATAASYTPPKSDANVAGVHTYTRRAKDNVCNTTLTPSVGNWILTIVCPDFTPGAIATAGQTITVGGTPITINSVQNATGSGTIGYQWYKNDIAITGATEAYYTPPPADAAVIGANTYTRRAKDNTCNTTLTPSEGMWVLIVCSDINSGVIATDGQTITVGGIPVTINSVQNASGTGNITYQWYKNGEAITDATEAYYTPPPADATVVGANTYTRRAKDNLCNTTFIQSTGSWVLTVTCPFDAGAIATDGQTILIGGTPATINSMQDATAGGTISYQWYKNGNAISGATATNYTPPPADAGVAGANTYTRYAKDNLCNTTFTSSAGIWVLTVTPCLFNAGTIATDGQTVCSGNAVNTITSSADASGSDNSISYQWRRNGSTIYDATAATYSPVAYNATVGAHTFTRWAHDGSCKTNWTQSAGSWVLTVTEGTQLVLNTANNNQIIANGAAITLIRYTTANASTVTCTGLPAGIIGTLESNTLTISGNSTEAGTHSYLVSVIGIAGCVNAYASGSIKIYPTGIDEYGCVSSNLTLGTVGFASTLTHMVSGAYGSQTWSAPVTAAYCDKTTYNGGETDSYRSDCRNNTQALYGHLYSWCMVKQYALKLCPAPWRSPSASDFCTLHKNLASASDCNQGVTLSMYLARWGAQLGGSTMLGIMLGQGAALRYWTTTGDPDARPWCVYSADGTARLSDCASKHDGYSLRCVL
jgi:uncharacterized protein (TIGR02145 family)